MRIYLAGVLLLGMALSGCFVETRSDGGPAAPPAQATPVTPAQPTPTPTGGKGVTPGGPAPAAPEPGAAADGVICRADKIATVNEVDHAGPQRMEVSTGDLIHLDYYRERGVPAVSVIVQKDESAVLKGFGSMWQFPLRDCSSYDFLKDATDYARVRQAWNHSGLVYASLSDYLAERPPAASLYGTDPKRVRPVVAESRMALRSTQGTQSSAACGDGERLPDQNPVVGQPWVVPGSGKWRVVNFWSNQPGANQKERKLLLGPNDNPQLLGGGAAWAWPANCEALVREHFAKNQLQEVTLDQLRSEQLVR